MQMEHAAEARLLKSCHDTFTNARNTKQGLQLNTRGFVTERTVATTKNRKAFEIWGLAPGNDT